MAERMTEGRKKEKKEIKNEEKKESCLSIYKIIEE